VVVELRHPDADPAGGDHLGQRQRQAAVGHIVDAGQHTVTDELTDERGDAAGRVEIGRRQVPALGARVPRPPRAGEARRIRSSEDEDRGIVREGRPRRAPDQLVDDPEEAHDRCRVDVVPAGLVVEAHVAAYHRYPERPARLGHPVDGLRQLRHHLGVLWVAEVEAVDERQRACPHAGQVDDGLGHDPGGASPG
jgi:hypothetical protein